MKQSKKYREYVSCTTKDICLRVRSLFLTKELPSLTKISNYLVKNGCCCLHLSGPDMSFENRRFTFLAIGIATILFYFFNN